MTEWDASGYAQISKLQQAMAAEVLDRLELRGNERILDVGCGNGRVTSEIAARTSSGTVVGVDASEEMIAFAAGHYRRDNLRFEVADARRLPFRAQFDLVVSLNALHWIPEQHEALRAIGTALKPAGAAQLRLVPKGPRKSLEESIEETRHEPRWARYFADFRDPYLRLTPEQYARTAAESGFEVKSLRTEDVAWDFKSRAGFEAFASVTFVEWNKRLPEYEKPEFIRDVLDRYRSVSAGNLFRFYQMDITLAAR